MGFPTDRSAVVRRLGERADEPATAAGVVGTTALAFSGLYYGNMVLGHWGSVAAGEYEAVAGLTALFLLTVTNAAVVTWLVWSSRDLSDEWGYRRGAATGLLVGVASHLTLGLVVVAWSLLAGRASMTTGLSAVPSYFLIVFASVVFTAGVPLVLSVGSALALTHCRKRVRAD
ncbi:hypothetical protein ACFQMA_05395 [Halosimplex aquaticum]|uniref:Uncharacterized protein n=1 Tax=Halosimplex aquaticum TaxID=3026162 RepID=A0ABD5XVY2_9EURY|nr:hypothetical protein [Halosimplex aquaticum]